MILYLALALAVIYVMEQPSGSEKVLARHQRFQKYCNEICYATLVAHLVVDHFMFNYPKYAAIPTLACEVFKERFWMMLHGAGCPKPTICWSNDEHLVQGLAPILDSKGPTSSCHLPFFATCLQLAWLSGPWPAVEVCQGCSDHCDYFP